MKILYISSNKRSQQFPWLIDYQNDSLLYGLKELFGDDVVDVNKKYNLYSDYSDEEVASEYGRGFTFTRLIDTDNCDREDVVKKIKNNFFDLVVYGSIWRCQDYLQLVREHYKPNQIVFVDGEDTQDLHELVTTDALYFKRECALETYGKHQDHLWKVNPISFAFPTKKINFGDKKERRVAHSDPRNKATYVFNKESDYYQDYQFSKYALTMKKAGWDALRHYEIMGNGCIPFFMFMADCPRYTMYRFPKALLTKVIFFNDLDQKWLDNNYETLRHDLLEHFEKFNTTKALGEYFLKDVKNYSKM